MTTNHAVIMFKGVPILTAVIKLFNHDISVTISTDYLSTSHSPIAVVNTPSLNPHGWHDWYQNTHSSFPLMLAIIKANMIVSVESQIVMVP